MITVAMLNSRVTFDNPTQVITPSGDTVVTYASLGQFWAHVKQVSSKQQVMQGASDLRNIYQITLRKTTGISNATRITYEGKTLSVQSVEQVTESKKEFIKILAAATV